jgi:hypothetical protein
MQQQHHCNANYLEGSYVARRHWVVACRDLQLMRVELLNQVEAPYKRKCDILMKVQALQLVYMSLLLTCV